MSADTSRSQILWQLLLKEIDVINDTIRNLDDIIHKTKNFAFLVWGGSLYLFAEHLTAVDEKTKTWLYLLTAVIPLLFWMMDLRWRKHLLMCSAREKIISYFVNGKDFERLIQQGQELPDGEKFPFYDAVGWIYTRQKMWNSSFEGQFEPKYLLNESDFRWWKVIFYKDAYIFYGSLMLFSLVFGVMYAWK